MSETEQLPPHDEMAENGVLGCILSNSAACLPVAVEHIQTPSAFFLNTNRTVWVAMMEMAEAGRAIDVITLRAWLNNKGQLEEAGGYPRISALPDDIGCETLIEHYIAIVMEKARDRYAVQLNHEFAKKFAMPREGSSDALTGDFVSAVGDLPSATLKREETTREALKRVLDFLAEREQDKSTLWGLSTGFSDLDRLTKGFSAGQMIVLAGRPGNGKSAFAMQIVDHVVCEQGKRALVFSLEMSSRDLLTRMVHSRARASLTDGYTGKHSPMAAAKIGEASKKLNTERLCIREAGAITIAQLTAYARRTHLATPLDLVVVDYLQIVKTSGRKYGNRQEEVSHISIELKSLAMELKIPVLVVAQLNREVEKESRKPKMSDLRESGQIEQDADLVAMLYSDPALGDKTMNFRVVKHRNGPTAELQFYFFRDQTRFEQLETSTEGET